MEKSPKTKSTHFSFFFFSFWNLVHIVSHGVPRQYIFNRTVSRENISCIAPCPQGIFTVATVASEKVKGNPILPFLANLYNHDHQIFRKKKICLLMFRKQIKSIHTNGEKKCRNKKLALPSWYSSILPILRAKAFENIVIQE